MDCFLVNTENNKRVAFQYVDSQLSLGGIQANYQSADIPQSVLAPQYWIRTDAVGSSIVFYFDDSTAKTIIKDLKTLCYPATPGTNSAPPIVGLKVANLDPMLIHVLGIVPQYDLNFKNTKGEITRTTLTISFVEIDFEKTKSDKLKESVWKQ